jgi:hypothetical protein
MTQFHSPVVGQIWHWRRVEDSQPWWDELMLIVGHEFPNEDACLAINLQTGLAGHIFLNYSPRDWELLIDVVETGEGTG